MSLNEAIPLYFEEGARRAALAVAELEDVAVCCHVRPDGDAAGSLACAGYMLDALKIRYFLYSESGLPPYLGFFSMPGRICRHLADAPFQPKSALVLDLNDPSRLDPEMAAILPDLMSVNIDHHLGGEGLGSLASWVEPRAAATAQLMAYVAAALGFRLGGGLADSVALGLITDTGGFCHGNTTADVFALCARLARSGCDIPGLREHISNCLTLGCMHLRGRLMQRVRLEEGGRVAFCAVRLDDFSQCGCRREELEGFVEQMRRLASTLVAALLREEDYSLCKFSLRSSGDVDVRAMAASLGGGGHLNAAGGIIRKPLEEASRLLLSAVGQVLAQTHGGLS